MLEGVLEGLLFVVGEDGLTLDTAKDILNVNDEELNEIITSLENTYNNKSRGLMITKYGSYLRLTTKPNHKEYFERLIETEDDSVLSQACLETLAIIAYNQPVNRMTVDEIRGINSSHIIRKLVCKCLIKEVGRSDTPGRPILYSVTKDFLDYFGLDSVDKLPKMEEIKVNEDSEKDLYESKYKENN